MGMSSTVYCDVGNRPKAAGGPRLATLAAAPSRFMAASLEFSYSHRTGPPWYVRYHPVQNNHVGDAFMSGEVRPDFSKTKVTTLVILLALGIALLFGAAYGVDPDKFSLSPPTSLKLGELPAEAFILEKRNVVWAVTFSAFATALITVSLYELAKLFVQYVLWFRSKRRQLNAFFGEGAGEHSEDAEIIAQTDPLNEMLKDLVPDSDRNLAAQPGNRLYKARHWVNRYDIEAGRAILKLFRKEGLKVPNFKAVDRKRKLKPPKYPFKVIIGMGFSDESQSLEPKLAQWMHIERNTVHGDALCIHRYLLPAAWEKRLQAVVHPSEPRMRLVFPLDWDLERWLDKPQEVNDYAFILRYEPKPAPGADTCVYFWLAGFTDRATAAAGRYLAEQWEDLYDRFVRSKSTGSSTDETGNFFIVIEGKSSNADLARDGPWTEVVGFEVTPAKLAQHHLQWAVD